MTNWVDACKLMQKPVRKYDARGNVGIASLVGMSQLITSPGIWICCSQNANAEQIRFLDLAVKKQFPRIRLPALCVMHWNRKRAWTIKQVHDLVCEPSGPLCPVTYTDSKYQPARQNSPLVGRFKSISFRPTRSPKGCIRYLQFIAEELGRAGLSTHPFLPEKTPKDRLVSLKTFFTVANTQRALFRQLIETFVYPTKTLLQVRTFASKVMI